MTPGFNPSAAPSPATRKRVTEVEARELKILRKELGKSSQVFCSGGWTSVADSIRLFAGEGDLARYSVSSGREVPTQSLRNTLIGISLSRPPLLIWDILLVLHLRRHSDTTRRRSSTRSIDWRTS